MGVLLTFYGSLSVHVPLRGFSQEQFCLFSLANNVRFRLTQLATCLVEKSALHRSLRTDIAVIRLTDYVLYVYEA